MKLKALKEKIKRGYSNVAGEVAMWWLWIKNLFFVYATTKSQIRIFKGYMHYWFAQKYADKRTKISMINKVCGGKRHYVLPAGDYSLVVLNRLELQALKGKGYYSKQMNIVEVHKNAYYISKGTELVENKTESNTKKK